MTPDQLMKKCQLGCGGKNALWDCHDILAECYGTIGKLLIYIDELGGFSDTCTFHVTGRVCSECQCNRKHDT